jgi:peptidoglycan/LPS O-acetylase OafA/YrhL
MKLIGPKWRALRIGVMITATVFLMLIIGDLWTPRTELALLRRNPLAWLFYWPTVFWSHSENMKDLDFIGALLVNLIVYSLIAFIALRLIKNHA